MIILVHSVAKKEVLFWDDYHTNWSKMQDLRVTIFGYQDMSIRTPWALELQMQVWVLGITWDSENLKQTG